MEFLDLIDHLEELVENGRRVPMTGKSMVDTEVIAALIDRMRAAVPEEMQEAYEIRARGETIVSEAILMAKKIRANAEQEHRARIEESPIIEEAEEKAAEIRAEAEREGQRIRQRADADAASRIQEADAYAEHSLSRLASHVAVVRERTEALEAELAELERAVEAGARYLQARWSGATNGNGRGHSDGPLHANERNGVNGKVAVPS